MNLTINNTAVQIADAEVAEIVRRHLSSASLVSVVSASFPMIGSPYSDGIYGGLTFRDNRAVPMILLPGDHDGMSWQKALDLAKKEGAEVPKRIDQLLLFERLKAQFKPEYYWSGEPYGAYAWCQSFGGGGQYYGRKFNDCRVRLVRIEY